MQTPLPRPIALTYENYFSFPDDGNRHEILEGEHHVTPTPSSGHQGVAARLLYLFHLQVRGGFAFTAPLGVVLSTISIVEPDICYLGEEKLSLVSRRGIEGAPDIVVEILSPSTSRVDETTKRQIYAKYGVGEYWLVDEKRGTVSVCTRSEAGFAPADDRLLAGSDRLSSPLAPGLDVAVEELFALPWLRTPKTPRHD
jgi:Uma2 family endonuclease